MVEDITKIPADMKDSWMKPILDYLLKGILIDSAAETHEVQIKSKRYIIIDDRLYRKSAEGYLGYLPPNQANIILKQINEIYTFYR